MSVPFDVQVEVNKIVRNLREQRQGMIQTKVSRLLLVHTVTVRKPSLNCDHEKRNHHVSISTPHNLLNNFVKELKRKSGFYRLQDCSENNMVFFFLFNFTQDQYIFCYKACLEVLQSLNAR